MTYQEPTTTIALLSGNQLVSRVIKSLLKDFGHEVRLLEETSEAYKEGIFEDIDLVLLAHTLSDGFQRAFLTSMRREPKTASMPVLTLSTALEETVADRSGFVPWPCRIEELARHIEAALQTVVADKRPVEDSTRRLTTALRPVDQ